jgi:hypothetical protein
MMLCAVFRAIFLPAALVADGCFRFEFEAFVEVVDAACWDVVDLVAATVECADAAAEAPGGM